MSPPSSSRTHATPQLVRQIKVRDERPSPLRAVWVKARGALADAKNSSAALDADLLLAHALGVNREYLHAHPERLLTNGEQLTFDEYVRRRVGREPLAYITGKREFYGLDLQIDRRVLVPRPATECLVDHALAWWRTEAVPASPVTEPALIVEAGTGSGAIALALAAKLPDATVVAGERLAAAARVAAENSRRLNLRHRVHVVVADLQPPTGPIPLLVVANLPYVPSAEIDRLEPDIRDHEPRTALDGGPDGFDICRRFLSQVRVQVGGAVFIEIGHDQAELVRHAAATRSARLKVDITPDLEGFDRVALISGW